VLTLRIGNLSGRLSLFVVGGAVDVEKASAGRFGPDPQDVYPRWDEFGDWYRSADLSDVVAFDPTELGPPTPAPAQVFAIGLNYAEHAAESGFAVPDTFPPVFTKFRTALAGPVTTVTLPPGGNVDWEVELVAVIGRRAEHVPAAEAWSHIAGLTVGQDISERISQLSGPAPQFSLGKSFPGFAPLGPWLVSVDEFSDPDDLELHCAVDGETVQHGRTRDFVFGVGALVEGLSREPPLLPGDVLYSGTPSAVRVGRKPPRFLAAGQELVSRIEGIGELRQRFVAA
jgi:2-keto-4-pentenoate hydratase/2-oxohepta-3-ene-1,7-dioic acid hydratase in catechol pathway